MSGYKVLAITDRALVVRVSAEANIPKMSEAAKVLIRFSVSGRNRALVITGIPANVRWLTSALAAAPNHPLVVARESDSGCYYVRGDGILGDRDLKVGAKIEAAELGL